MATNSPSNDEAILSIVELNRFREVWRAALTLANNLCVQESDRINADDGSVEAMGALSEAARRIRGWIEPDDNQLLEMLREANALPTSSVETTDAQRLDFLQSWIEKGKARGYQWDTFQFNVTSSVREQLDAAMKAFPHHSSPQKASAPDGNCPTGDYPHKFATETMERMTKGKCIYCGAQNGSSNEEGK